MRAYMTLAGLCRVVCQVRNYCVDKDDCKAGGGCGPAGTCQEGAAGSGTRKCKCASKFNDPTNDAKKHVYCPFF